MSNLDDLLRSKKAPTVLKHSPRRAGGYGFITDPNGGVTESETLQCCHCSGIWIFRAGSGIRRGFCFKCAAITCGTDACDECVPVEKMIEQREAAHRLIIATR